jgi:hypothetical protein
MNPQIGFCANLSNNFFEKIDQDNFSFPKTIDVVGKRL